MKLKQILTVGMVFAGVCGGAISPAQSKQPLRRTFISDSGLTTIQIVQPGKSEYIGAPIGRYNQKGGSSGYLMSTEQDDPMGFYTRFHDTSGRDRCVGRMHLFVDDSGKQFNSRATWIIDGAVPGYSCSTTGKTFELRMQQV
jgi:hypothetical protein